jgi:hypothetical protein
MNAIRKYYGNFVTSWEFMVEHYEVTIILAAAITLTLILVI